MSRSINESIQTLENSLSDIKTSLSAKNVEGGEQIKVSQVAGLIDQIQAGGSGSDSSFKYIENVTFAGESISSSIIYNLWTMGDTYLSGTLQFTPKEDNIYLYYCCQNRSYLTGDGVGSNTWNSLTKGKAYTITFNKTSLPCFFVFTKEELFTREKRENFDVLCITTEN